jgi:hypothetical protein
MNGRATRPRSADSSQGSAGILPASAPAAISRRCRAASPYPGKAKKSLLHREGLSSFQLSVFYVQLLPSPSLPLRNATSSSFSLKIQLLKSNLQE